MKKWLPIFALLLSIDAFGQNKEIDLEQFAESFFQTQDEPIAYEDIYESLLVYYIQKLNLNKASKEELATLYILNPTQLQDFIQYRSDFGKLLSIHELQVIPSFNLSTIQQLLPFVTVEESSAVTKPFHKRVMEAENSNLLLRYKSRLEQQVGYKNSSSSDSVKSLPPRYLGDRNKLYGRLRTHRKGDFSFGFTFEKDEGETVSFQKNQNGFDFYSYHLLMENKLGFNKIMMGDFQLQVGQGLIFGAGFNPGKGAETINSTKRNTLGFRPYTSVLETGFFRGVGLSKAFRKWELLAFYSRLKQDGTIRSDTTFSDFDEFVNSIQKTGLHRTENELRNMNRVNEASFGGVIHFKPNRNLSLGLAALRSSYSTPLQRTPNNYNQFEFQGDRNHIQSIFGQYNWQNIVVFGEVAQSKSSGIGGVGGLISSLSKKIDLAMVFRNYEKNFHSFYGNSFAESSRNINEKGVYWGLSIAPNHRHKINLYYDWFRFPWLRYGTEAPSDGNEWLIRYTYKPAKSVLLYAQLRQQTKQVNRPIKNLNTLTDQTRYNYLFNVTYALSPNLELKTKVQGSHQTEAGLFTKGFAILQDIMFKVWVLKVNARAALFDTDNFDNAQYVYENDVLYAFSIPAYSGRGIRNYVMIRFDPLKRVSMWVRYGRFTYRDREKVGSGLELSDGNTSSEIKVMARIKI